MGKIINKYIASGAEKEVSRNFIRVLNDSISQRKEVIWERILICFRLVE